MSIVEEERQADEAMTRHEQFLEGLKTKLEAAYNGKYTSYFNEEHDGEDETMPNPATGRRSIGDHSELIRNLRQRVARPTGNHADYAEVQVGDDTIFIRDLNLGNKSITNDAEWVVEQLLAKHGNKHIIYKDSEGQWDELLHDGTRFIDFGPYKGGEPDAGSIEMSDMEMKL